MSHHARRTLNSGALAALASLATLAACGGSDSTQPNEAAFIRVVNVSPTTGPISASAEGRTVQANVAFQSSVQTGGCGTIEKGSDEEIQFVNAGTQNGLGSIQFNFVAQNSYTVVFYAANDAQVYPESFTAPSAGNNAIRFINATGAAGDIYLTTTTANLPASPTLANLANRQASGFNASTAPGGTFAQYPNNQIRVRVFNPGQTTNPRMDFNIGGIPSNGVATIVLTPTASSGQAAVMVGACTG